MPKWLVTHGEEQFSAQNLAELKTMAQDGRLLPADLIQPPEASDWLYAMELPALKGCFTNQVADEEPFIEHEGSAGRKILAASLVVVIVAALGTMNHFWGIIKHSNESEVNLGPGETILNQDVDLLSEPRGYRGGSTSVIGSLEQGTTITVILKQMNRDDGNWLQIHEGSQQGWIPAGAVPPSFLYDEDSTVTNKALYYPEDFVSIDGGMSWLSISDENFGDGADDYIRISDLTISNTAEYAMENVVVAVESYDDSGAIVNRTLFEIEQEIPAETTSLPVGGVFPVFVPPDIDRFRNLSNRDLADDIVDHLEDYEESGPRTVQNYCNEIQHTYLYEEVMETIDHQEQDEIMMLSETMNDLDGLPPRWKHCFDIEFDDDGDHEGVRVRIFQVRPILD